MPKPRAPRRAAPKRPQPPPRRALHYKVVELSSVDEGALERTLNEWAPLGWTFDGVQFAMRESSKRPSMAFVFFTREGAPLEEPAAPPAERHRDAAEAERHLARLAEGELRTAAPPQDAWARLQALAGEDEP